MTVAHGHPFTASPEFCLVHNGSFSNHATIRRELMARHSVVDELIVVDDGSDDGTAQGGAADVSL